ncbi:hypothetical protein M9H77_23032 [Catharanthus roseus]|uniref:Uncharacterized protein n=1 Tax=Catharanthus roseus TaxID=4058 RepID=A0ACC0AT31_CATRO|nr:hypothetical protein M9H77_23032 [Catharanthus roseus]
MLEETPNENSCDDMNAKSIDKEECNEFKEKDRVEEKKRLVERLCVFDSISIISKESEHFECSNEKELEKSERNFEDSSKDEDGKPAYKSIKTINFFLSNSYLSFEIYFKEIKKETILMHAIPRVDESHLNIANDVSYDPLMSSGVKFDPSCYGFGMLDDTSIIDLELECALSDVLHDKSIGNSCFKHRRND